MHYSREKKSNNKSNNNKWFHFPTLSRFHAQTYPFTQSLFKSNGTYFRHSNPIQIADIYSISLNALSNRITNDFISNDFKIYPMRLGFLIPISTSVLLPNGEQTLRISIFISYTYRGLKCFFYMRSTIRSHLS